ncbi:MAG: hypothetical protein U0324_37900 [Polyangiales bacterium]
MGFESTLTALLHPTDLRPLTAALCACARRQLPRAMAQAPYNRVIVETTEAWLAGTASLAEISKVLARASNTRGAAFTVACVRVLVEAAPAREATVRRFAQQLPTALWMASEDGRRWAARVGPAEAVGDDPEAVDGIDAVESDLCALVQATTAQLASAAHDKFPSGSGPH